MKFQYWRVYGKRPEAKGDITDTMSSIGACFFMHKDRFFDSYRIYAESVSLRQVIPEATCPMTPIF